MRANLWVYWPIRTGLLSHAYPRVQYYGMFNKAASGGKRELVVRRDALSEGAASTIEDGTDTSLFSVTGLNNLQLSGFNRLPHLARVGELSSLLQLSLTENHLQSLPEEVGSLHHLRLLDVSHNDLTSLPASLFHLPALQTLLLAHNSLTDSSFPSTLDTGEPVLPNLHQLDMGGNQLTSLPSFLTHTHHLAELKLSHNSLSSLDSTLIKTMASLRLLEAHNNHLLGLPHELAGCSKIKSLQLEGNPLKDRRLLKLVAQHGTHKPRAVLDYLASRAPQPGQGAGKKKGKARGKGKAVVVEDESEDSDVEFSNKVPVVTIVRPGKERALEVVATDNARRVRPYLVCAVLCGVELGQQETLREFLALQTRLHDTVCKRRRSATIATHDLSKVSSPVSYLSAPATEIVMTPLGWSEEVKVQQFLAHIQANKPDRSGGKKAKGVDTAAASLFKYLQYVNSDEMVYLRDSSGTVISLPPLTNSDNTKVVETTRQLLLEVTSSESLAVAKMVMDAVVTGVGGMKEGRGEGVQVEQVRVVDEAGQLLVLYPSRTDLVASSDIEVVRPD